MSIEEIIQQAVEQAVKSALSQVSFKTNNCTDASLLLSAKEASKLLDIPYTKFMQMHRVLDIPYVKINSSYKFYKKDIIQWIEKNTENRTEFQIML